MKTRVWDRGGLGALTFTELGFGTAPLGGLYRAVSDEDAHATMTRAWDLGVRYFDTAPLYGLGQSEVRLNRVLRGRTRSDFVVSSKVGRLMRPPGKGRTREGIGKWFDVPNRVGVYDYSYDGVMRSLEFTLERTGLDRVDILYVHDLDVWTHGSREVMEGYRDAFMAGGYNALVSLRDQGVIRAIGGGINEWEQCQWLTERGDFDLFLLAGRYTLLEQEALTSFLPMCKARGIGIVIGGPYNSGILATGPKPGAFYNYDPAPDWVMEKVRRIEAVCSMHGVRMVDTAFQFPLLHPAVVSVIPGGVGVAEVEANARAAAAVIPGGLWADLKAQGLMRDDAPVGSAA
ncbi:MAG: aldo/keto reductase [Paracoccaceae bacterium]